MIELPKISVIVPIYNCEQFLRKCLDSLSNQTYKNIEVIMVDDGSTDNSGNICKEFSDNDKRFIYIRQENSGVSIARNKGIDYATGEFLGFCDSDDWAERDEFEFLYELISEGKSDIAVCGYCVDTNSESKLRGNSNERIIANAEQAIEVILKDNTYGGYLWNKLFKKKIIANFRLHEDIHMYEDLLFVCELFDKCESIAFNNKPKYHYYRNANSAILGKFREKEWSGQIAYDKIIAIVCKKYNKVLPYVQAEAIIANLSIANKLAAVGLLNKENYLSIKNKLKEVINRQSKKELSKRTRYSLRVLLSSRLLFILYRKILTKIRG